MTIGFGLFFAVVFGFLACGCRPASPTIVASSSAPCVVASNDAGYEPCDIRRNRFAGYSQKPRPLGRGSSLTFMGVSIVWLQSDLFLYLQFFKNDL